MVAAATVASWFPTPTPFKEAWVAKVPERELEKACVVVNKEIAYITAVTVQFPIIVW